MGEADTPIPIGAPCCGDEAWAEREEGGGRAGAGETGELVVRGPTVMLGYFGHAPHPKGAPYRTGDWVRVRQDGGFDYLGRRDGMVKLRGHRVELGEIEATLGRHPAIREAAATVVGTGMHARLVAALVPRVEPRPTLLELKAACGERLPRYMIIDRAVWFGSLPRTDNGKLDRRAIAAACEAPGGQDGH
jgi:clorobiocin biosynthesis protein CloN4